MIASSKSPHEDVERVIRATGAKVTSARIRVLRLLQSAPIPLGHGDMEASLSKEGLPGIDRVTLYRVLDWLVESGLAHKAADTSGVFRFSLADRNREHVQHVHFRCTQCGGVFCLDAPPPPPPDLPRGFRFASMELDIRGECPRCVSTRS
ncbi:MAG: transcriptional repressor [Rhodocyclaceae bacterium]|nr:MAG: transcriptional repressor [Rhodocyclaceae bacterium]